MIEADPGMSMTPLQILVQYHGKQIDLSDNKYSIVNDQEISIFMSKKKIFVSWYDPKKSDIMKLSC